MERDLLVEHKPYFGKESKGVRVKNLNPGDVIKFDYRNKLRYVLVLNADWENKLHGLTLRHVPHRLIPNILKEVVVKKPVNMYLHRVRQNPVLYYDSYRTYDIPKMISVRKVEYLKFPGKSLTK